MLEQILIAHSRQYPKMQPTDAVKLIYQNEFGGGHLIRDTEACLNYLVREYASVVKNSAAVRCEDIGNGMIRVHLAALEEEKLADLGKVFIRSAAEHTGSMERFLSKLDVLKKLTAEGVFAFGTEELEAYLVGYAEEGYPPVSHSPAYRQMYRPAYRVVLAKYWLER